MVAMSTMSTNLPLGIRFRPTEVEIIDYYLRLKITGNDGEVGFIPVVDFYKQEPWELPGLSGFETTDHQRFCFSPPDMKRPNGKHFNRTTNFGYWKVTGNDKEIRSGGRLIGKKKILVFYLGSTANSKKTDWVMHEHRTTLEELDGTESPGQKPLKYVFCRLFYKPKEDSGKAGPANCKLAEDHPITSNECLHPENSDGMAYDTIPTGTAKLASESPNKGSKGRKRNYSSKAGPAKSKRGAASASPATGEFLHSDTIPSVECSNSNSSAENQVAEMKQVVADEVDLQPESNLWTPLTSLSDTAAVLSPNTAKSSPEEAESDRRQASASPASGKEADNHVTSYFDESTSNTKAFTGCNDVNMSCAPPELPVADKDWSPILRCPTDSQMQKVLESPFRMSSSVAIEPNYLNDGVALQNGTVDSDAYIFELRDLLLPDYADELLRIDPSSQKTTIPFDSDYVSWNLLRTTDHTVHQVQTCSMPLFDPTVQDSMRSVEVNREAVSSGSYVDGGTSSIRSSYEFGY